jgi:probable phosphoglycerate mutase
MTEAADYIAGRSAGVHLTQTGKEEAEAASEILSNFQIDKLFSSPLERTLETAGIFSKKLNLKIEINKQVTEVDFGDWTRKQFRELEEDEKWKLFNSFRSGTRIPNGEMMTEVQSRMVKEIERIRNTNQDKNIIIVSHGDPIRLTVSHYMGIPIDFILRLKINTASITILRINNYGPELICYNYSGDLTRLIASP